MTSSSSYVFVPSTDALQSNSSPPNRKPLSSTNSSIISDYHRLDHNESSRSSSTFSRVSATSSTVLLQNEPLQSRTPHCKFTLLRPAFLPITQFGPTSDEVSDFSNIFALRINYARESTSSCYSISTTSTIRQIIRGGVYALLDNCRLDCRFRWHHPNVQRS